MKRFQLAVCFYTLALCLFSYYSFPASAYAHHGSNDAGWGVTDGVGALINSPTASTLPKNAKALGFAFSHQRYNTIPASNAHALHHQGREVHGKNHDEIYDFVLGYGVVEDLDIQVDAPIVSKKVIEVHGHRRLGAADRFTGFGDMSVTARYRFWKRIVQAAIISGVKAPTGETSIVNPDRRKVDPELQPGTGSWDGQFGVACTGLAWERWTLGGSFLYGLKGEGAQGFKAGDIFAFNLGCSYPLRKAGQYPNASIVAEINQQWALKDTERSGERPLDSGGYQMFVSPGITVDFTSVFGIFASMPIAAYQKLGGEHEETKYLVQAGTRFRF